MRGEPDIQLLTDRWNDTLRALGIGAVHVEGRRFWIDRPNHAPQPLHIPQMSLDEFMTEEMNRPFAPTGGLPFRPFIILREGSYLAGVVYHHWVADSASIRMIMHEWFVRCFDPSKARTEPVPIATRGYWHYFGPRAARWDFDSSFMTSASWFSRFRRVRRIESPGVHDFTMRFTLHRFPDDAIGAIRAAARAHQVTVNDFFLAAMAQACDLRIKAGRCTCSAATTWRWERSSTCAAATTRSASASVCSWVSPASLSGRTSCARIFPWAW